MKIKDLRPIVEYKSADMISVGNCFVKNGTPYLVSQYISCGRADRLYVNLLTGEIVDFYPYTQVQVVDAEVVIDNQPGF